VTYSKTLLEEVHNTRKEIKMSIIFPVRFQCVLVTRQQMIRKEMEWLVLRSIGGSTSRFRVAEDDEGETSGQKPYRTLMQEAG
jgi:hypothetical protein